MPTYRLAKLGSLRGVLAFQVVANSVDGTGVTTRNVGRATSLPLLAVGGRIADLPRIIQANLGRLLVLALNGFVDFAPMNRYFARRLDPQSYLVAAHVDDSYNDVIANNDALVALSGKHKHDATTAL
jgi:hypothetical protein